MLLHGDCLAEMKLLEDETIDLAYLDPPFFTQKKHALKTRDNREEFSFEDTWGSLGEYLAFIESRLLECRRVLKNTGSIFLHCDKNASCYLRMKLDEVFGIENFRNEIIWTYKRWTNSKNSLQSAHQSIYYYSKSDGYKFHTLYKDYAVTTNIDQILQERARNEHGKSVYKTDNSGNIVFGRAKKGVPLGDVWHIPFLNPKAKERVGYPTQKPVLLLERIIKLSTDPNDLVLDPFCGSGTTLVAAQLQGRRFIGIDKSIDAINISKERLRNPTKTNSQLLEKGEREYLNKTNEEIQIIRQLGALPVQRNSGIDAFLSPACSRKLIPIKIQKPTETFHEALQKLAVAAKKRNCDSMIIVRTENPRHERLCPVKTCFDHINLLVLDSHDLAVRNWLKSIDQIYPLAVPE